MSVQKMLRIMTAVSLAAECAAAWNDTSNDGDEFSNNLFSDLAPLLTLFGEQVCPIKFTVSSCMRLKGIAWLTYLSRSGRKTIHVTIIGLVRQHHILYGAARDHHCDSWGNPSGRTYMVKSCYWKSQGESCRRRSRVNVFHD